jgi:hypothetical protein
VKLFGSNKIGNLISEFLLILHLETQELQRSEVQGAIYEGSQKISEGKTSNQKIRFPNLLPPHNFT